jgi:hypothetical protein
LKFAAISARVSSKNSDPFLAQAFLRNRQAAKMPQLLFLHGNVQVGICPVDGVKVFRGQMATLQNDPWHDNPFPKLKSLSRLHAWLAPLIAEEHSGRFTGDPCLHLEDFSEAAPQEPKKIGMDWVLPWLKLMCKGEMIPPFCVEVVMRDGARYSLHSVLEYDDETHTICDPVALQNTLHRSPIVARGQPSHHAFPYCSRRAA